MYRAVDGFPLGHDFKSRFALALQNYDNNRVDRYMLEPHRAFASTSEGLREYYEPKHVNIRNPFDLRGVDLRNSNARYLVMRAAQQHGLNPKLMSDILPASSNLFTALQQVGSIRSRLFQYLEHQGYDSILMADPRDSGRTAVIVFHATQVIQGKQADRQRDLKSRFSEALQRRGLGSKHYATEVKNPQFEAEHPRGQPVNAGEFVKKADQVAPTPKTATGPVEAEHQDFDQPHPTTTTTPAPEATAPATAAPQLFHITHKKTGEWIVPKAMRKLVFDRARAQVESDTNSAKVPEPLYEFLKNGDLLKLRHDLAPYSLVDPVTLVNENVKIDLAKKLAEDAYDTSIKGDVWKDEMNDTPMWKAIAEQASTISKAKTVLGENGIAWVHQAVREAIVKGQDWGLLKSLLANPTMAKYFDVDKAEQWAKDYEAKQAKAKADEEAALAESKAKEAKQQAVWGNEIYKSATGDGAYYAGGDAYDTLKQTLKDMLPKEGTVSGSYVDQALQGFMGNGNINDVYESLSKNDVDDTPFREAVAKLVGKYNAEQVHDDWWQKHYKAIQTEANAKHAKNIEKNSTAWYQGNKKVAAKALTGDWVVLDSQTKMSIVNALKSKAPSDPGVINAINDFLTFGNVTKLLKTAQDQGWHGVGEAKAVTDAGLPSFMLDTTKPDDRAAKPSLSGASSSPALKWKAYPNKGWKVEDHAARAKAAQSMLEVLEALQPDEVEPWAKPTDPAEVVQQFATDGDVTALIADLLDKTKGGDEMHPAAPKPLLKPIAVAKIMGCLKDAGIDTSPLGNGDVFTAPKEDAPKPYSPFDGAGKAKSTYAPPTPQPAKPAQPKPTKPDPQGVLPGALIPLGKSNGDWIVPQEHVQAVADAMMHQLSTEDQTLKGGGTSTTTPGDALANFISKHVGNITGLQKKLEGKGWGSKIDIPKALEQAGVDYVPLTHAIAEQNRQAEAQQEWMPPYTPPVNWEPKTDFAYPVPPLHERVDLANKLNTALSKSKLDKSGFEYHAYAKAISNFATDGDIGKLLELAKHSHKSFDPGAVFEAAGIDLNKAPKRQTLMFGLSDYQPVKWTTLPDMDNAKIRDYFTKGDNLTRDQFTAWSDPRMLRMFGNYNWEPKATDLSPTEKAALPFKAYLNRSYGSMNKGLKEDPSYHHPIHDAVTAATQAVGKWPGNFTVFRGVGSTGTSALFKQAEKSGQTGEPFSDTVFQHTVHDPSKALGWGSHALFVIHGKTGFNIALPNYSYKGEQEILKDKKTKYKIVGLYNTTRNGTPLKIIECQEI